MVNCIGKLGSLTCGLLFSMSPIAMEDEWSFDELSTVVSASRINQTVLSAPNAVTIIDSAMIEASGFTKIADIFRLVPGMNVAHVNGRRYAVSYHGGNWDDTNWLQVLVNGRSAFMSNLSVIDWDVLGVELEDIEKVEIIRGPSASAYGSNSFAAAINIITKPIALQNDWTASTRFGIDHDQRNFARFTTSIDDANLRLTLNTVRYRGFSEMDDSKELYSAQFGYEQPLGKNDQINAYGHYSFGETGYQPPVEEANNDPRPRTLDSYAGQIIWQRSLDNQNSLETQIHHTVRNEDNFKLSPTIQELLLVDLTGTPFEDNADERFPTGRETFFTTKTQIETQYSWLNQQGFRAVGLLGIKRDTFESLPLTSSNNTFEQYTAFAGNNTDIQLSDKIDINLGLLAEKQNDDQVYFSPRFSLNLFISPLQSIRLTNSVARRLPTLLEKQLDIAFYTSDGDLFNRVSVPDDHLTPVILSNYELGYTGRSRQKAIDWNFSLYHLEVDNIVWINYVPDPTGPVDGYYLSLQNGGFYSTSGVEGEITYRPSQYNMYKFWFNKAKDLDLGQKNMEQAFLLNSPEKTPDNALGVMGSCEINQFRLSTMGFYIDRLNWDNSSETVNPYFRLDANVSRTFSIAGQIKATIKLGGQSLTGSYNEYSDQFEVDPHYYVSAKMEEFQMPRGLAKNEQKQRHAVPLRQSGR